MMLIGLVVGCLLVLFLILVAINQFIIIKEDKNFNQEMIRRVSKADKKIDVDLYKRIQKKVVDYNE